MKQNTHPSISRDWVGEVEELDRDMARASLVTRAEMAADERGLVHGGFTFGLADFAAMLAVNDPHVVLGASEVRFVAPVVVGQTMVATAYVKTDESAGKKRLVDVTVSVEGATVMAGHFTCFVLPKHVLDG